MSWKPNSWHARLGRAVGVTFISAALPLQAQARSSNITPARVLSAMRRVADWHLGHPDTKHPETGWMQAVGDVGVMALARISDDPKYLAAMLALGEANRWRPGPRMYTADDLCIGQLYTELYLLRRDERMIAPLRERFDYILAHPPGTPSLDFSQPRSEVAKVWSWCDALFMAPPAWMGLYAATRDKRYLEYTVREWWRTIDFLYDPGEHLVFRDSTYFDKRGPNGEKVFWARGNGWVIGGLVRVLQFLPRDEPGRPRFERLFRDLAARIADLQQPGGLWRSSLLDPQDFPEKETSGSGLFAYALSWGVNEGLLDRGRFEPVVCKAWLALVDCVAADGRLAHVQPAGFEPKHFDSDSTSTCGVGAFLLAGGEMYRLELSPAAEQERARMLLPNSERLSQPEGPPATAK